MHQMCDIFSGTCFHLWGAAVHSLKQHLSVAMLAAMSSLIRSQRLHERPAYQNSNVKHK
jgi:hypothetical protein